MNIVYYTSGVSGWGRIVIGISIYNALKRRNIKCKYTVISSTDAPFLTGEIDHIIVPIENENKLSPENYHSSVLYQILIELDPDIMIFDLIWFTTYHFIHKLKSKNIYICRQVADRFFSIDLKDKRLEFDPSHFDLMLYIEPFKCMIEMDSINPVILRNRDEILPKEEAVKKLELDESRPACLFSFNREIGKYEYHKKKYSYLQDIYQVVDTKFYKNGLFPEIDYFNAFDFIVCAGGYNQFWEAAFLDKEAVFEPVPLVFENQAQRINECMDFKFDENGADQLVDIMMNM